MLRIILLGAPGAGKGTQANYICERYKIPHISTGDMLRAELGKQTETGLKIKAIMERGDLVPDEVVLAMVRARVSQGCENGFLLDGFPRSLSQAQGLQELDVTVDFIIEVTVADDVIIERLSQRRVHPASGRVYHLKYKPPAKPDVDDETGEPLIQRADDKAEVVAQRLEVYHHQTKPLSAYYRKQAHINYIEVDGAQSVEKVSEEIDRYLQDALRD